MRLIRGIGVLVAVTVAAPAMADWVPYAGTPEDVTFSYDPQRTQLDGAITRVWIRIEGPRISARAAYVLSQLSLDCAHRTFQVTMTLSYDQTGNAFHSDNSTTTPRSVDGAPNPALALFPIVCAGH